MKRHSSRILVAVLALSLLAACSTAKDTGGKSSSGSGAVGVSVSNGASEMGIDQPDPAKAIYSKQFAMPTKPKHKVTVGILSLERKGQAAILKVVLTPDFTDLPTSEVISFKAALDSGEYSDWRPTMLDMTNLKKYEPLSSGGTRLEFVDGKALNGQPIYGWVVFAAPPAAVTQVDLTVISWMPRFTNVPIR